MPTLNPQQLMKLTELKGVVRKRPAELSAWRELADFCRQAGLVDDAVAHLSVLVGAYAAQGAVYRAIGVCREILSLEPEHQETKRTLADLYAREADGAAPAVTLPVSMSSALLPRRSRVVLGGIGIPGDEPVDIAAEAVDDDDIILDNDVLDDVDVDILDVDAIAGLTNRDGQVTLARPEQVPLF